MNRNKQIIASGLAIDLPSDLRFDINKPYSGCNLCGAVYQGPLDLRVPPGHLPENSMIAKLAYDAREEWRLKHSKTHSEMEHRMLALSGRWATPEAAQRLAALGIMSVVDMVIDDEVASALAEGSSIPEKEVES